MKNIIFSVSLLIATAAAGYLGYQYLQIKQAAQASQAVDGCMNIARFVYEDNSQGTNSIMVIEDIYSHCLNLKGYYKN